MMAKENDKNPPANLDLFAEEENTPGPPDPNRLARQFLVHSFLYYRLGESVIGDDAFDRIAESLRRERAANPKAEMVYAKLLDPVLGPEATGHQIRDYPPEIISTAFKLLYAHSAPEMEMAEFVERRGYSLNWE